MANITVDFDVFKEITSRRVSESMTENDIIRQLLGLPEKKNNIDTILNTLVNGWAVKGALFPTGTEFRSEYKGKLYYGKVENGQLMVNGKGFKSPSSAAFEVTGTSVNGWKFWQVKWPEKSNWTLMEKYNIRRQLT